VAIRLGLALGVAAGAWGWLTAVALAGDAIAMGSQRELFVDDYLIDRWEGTRLELKHPTPREVVFVHDAPWEGNVCAYHTVFQDGDLYRMYYRGGHYDETTHEMARPEVYCYAESRDGIHWARPTLGLHEFEGSDRNNIILTGLGTHNLAPFKDTNPACLAEQRYKAVAGGRGGLIPFASADGVRWAPLQSEPVITKGAFDSLNIAYWDPHRQHYVSYFRDFRDGVRDIKTCTSPDFLNWSEPDWLSYTGAPTQHLYTNAITSYFRAPHLQVGFPKRFRPDRNPTAHRGGGVSDCGFMTSRDGHHFFRWPEALVRPGTHPDRWVNRNNLAAWGLVVTQPDVPGGQEELSIYLTEGYYRGAAVRLRRYTFRMDGFVAVAASPAGGEMVTKPLILTGDAGPQQLHVNFATSAFGSIHCEAQRADGTPIPGYTLDESTELFGDQLDAEVTWKTGGDLSQLADTPFRLRFVMRDADLYALRFAPASEAAVAEGSPRTEGER
jgi:hypothetical protein